MSRIVFGIVAAVASFMLVESLTCNECSFNILTASMCSDVSCTTNTSVCFTGRLIFTSLPSFMGFNLQGCREPTGCNTTTNNTLLGATYQTTIECCSTDKCNPTQLSGAPSTKMTITATIGAAILASVLL